MFELVKEIVIDTISCEAKAITMEASIFDDLGADSLDAVEISLAIEERTGIAIEDDALNSIKTIGDIVRYLEGNK